MIGRIVARAAVVVLAALVIGWLAYDLRALSLDGRGVAEAQSARNPSQIARALSLFDQAAGDSADPTPRIDEARLLISLARTHEAIGILNAVVRSNPGSIVAWSLLAAATGPSDRRRQAQANTQLFGLFGHPVSYFPARGAVFSPNGLLTLRPGAVYGQVDTVRIAGTVVRLIGWSAVAGRSAGGGTVAPATDVLVFANGRFVGGATPMLSRPDVARFFRVAAAPVGFTLEVPVSELETGGRHASVDVVGTVAGQSSRLSVTCRPILQAFGCGP